jgi:hypothetical protein
MFNISPCVSVGCIPSRASLKSFTVDVLREAPRSPTASDSTTVGKMSPLEYVVTILDDAEKLREV